MIELLSNPEFAKQLGSRAKSTVDEMFNPYRQAQKLVAVYEEIFAETGRKRRSIANTREHNRHVRSFKRSDF